MALIQSAESPPVRPDPDGEVRGEEFSPIYISASKSARQDRILYELLVLVDAIRGGRAREKEVAVSELNKRLQSYHDAK